jgi:hypothetical protein
MTRAGYGVGTKGGKVDPTGSKLFMILVGAALVGIGVSMWHSPTDPDDSSLARSGWTARHKPISADSRQLLAVVSVGVGLALMAGMTIALVLDSN